MGGTAMGAGMGGEPQVNLDPTLAVGSGAGDQGGQQQTDDQILDQGAGDQQQDAGNQDGQGQENQDGQQQQQQAAAGKGNELSEEDTPLDAVEVPANIKALFNQPGVGPQIRNTWYSLAAYREAFPTAAVAREVSKVIPSVEAASAAIEARDSMEQFDDLFYSGDPGKRAEFADRLFKEDPDAASAVAVDAFEKLASYNPQAYREAADGLVLRLLGNLNREASERGNDPVFKNRMAAFDVLSFAMFGKPLAEMLVKGATRDPRAEQMSARERSIQDRENKFQEQTAGAFHKSANDHAIEGIIGNISTAVHKLITDSKLNITEGAQRELVGKVYSKIDAAMRADRDLRARMRREWRNGEMDAAHQQRVVEAITKDARGRMRLVVQSVFDDWTTNVLGINKGRQDKQRQAQSRTDITGGRPPVGGQRQQSVGSGVNSSRVDYSKTSDDDLLSGKASLRG